ncbi:olfactory receptor 11A1-like [Pseudophryne corroboree]|uniref:olfactory receptor 11A1-like n=1 Tax=Pseudophryne corroboree TaxID=495146 RepID=UPI003081E531
MAEKVASYQLLERTGDGQFLTSTSKWILPAAVPGSATGKQLPLHMLPEQGYPNYILTKTLEDVDKRERTTLLGSRTRSKPNDEYSGNNKCVFVTQYNTHATEIRHIVHKNTQILKIDPLLESEIDNNKQSKTMCKANETTFTEFILLGFHNIHNIKILLFCLFLVVYLLIVTENCLIITLISTCRHLNIPMYIFLRNLALADLMLTSNMIPKLLQVTWSEGATISKTGCIVQFYFHCVATYAQSLILPAMAFDRFLAICYPLHYSSLMSHKLCFHLTFWPWAIGIILMQSEVALIGQLSFCRSNIIDHFFCDFSPILQMVSADPYNVKFEDFFLTILLSCLPFAFIIASYFFILVAIIKITSNVGRRKAFSTCSSHLAAVCTFYGPLFAIYMFPVGGNTPNEHKVKSLLYTTLTPLMNPILYSMRNQEIKKASQQLFCRKRT